MIRVTRLTGKEFVVNAELVKFVEATPDTLISLRDGERIMVREDVEEVVRRIVDYARLIRTPVTEQF